MNTLPLVVSVRENTGRTVSGSFIDREWVLHEIAAGTWSFQLEGRLYLVGVGDMVLLPPHLLHIVRPQSKGALVQRVAHFELPGFSALRDFPYVLTLPPDTHQTMKRLFQQLKQEWLLQGPQTTLITGGLLAAMIGLYLRNHHRPKTSKALHLAVWPYVEKAVQFIHERFEHPGLSLSEISRASGLSMNYFCRMFKKHTGHSAMQYLNRLRIHKAAELLIRTPLNCSQIAEKTGFNSIHLFSRVFHRIMGCPPTAFKNRHAPRHVGG